MWGLWASSGQIFAVRARPRSPARVSYSARDVLGYRTPQPPQSPQSGNRLYGTAPSPSHLPPIAAKLPMSAGLVVLDAIGRSGRGGPVAIRRRPSEATKLPCDRI